MQKFIEMLSKNLKYVSHEETDKVITFYVESTIESPTCPYCGCKSLRKHSSYNKSFMDMPLNGKNVNIVIKNRKMFCDNPDCNHKTFAEVYDFVERKSKKTIRLKNYIIDTAANMSSIAAQNLLRKYGIKVGKSTICTFLKKR